MASEFNFIHESATQRDKEILFGPLSDDDTFISIQPGWTMAHVMQTTGVFPSIGQAKKNGWDKPIPLGFNEVSVGKRKLKIFTFIPIE